MNPWPRCYHFRCMSPPWPVIFYLNLLINFPCDYFAHCILTNFGLDLLYGLVTMTGLKWISLRNLTLFLSFKFILIFLVLTCQGDKVRVIQTLLFVAGINTLLQALFGTRLPAVVGGSYAYVIPILYIINDSSLQRISEPHVVSLLLAPLSPHPRKNGFDCLRTTWT